MSNKNISGKLNEFDLYYVKLSNRQCVNFKKNCKRIEYAHKNLTLQCWRTRKKSGCSSYYLMITLDQ